MGNCSNRQINFQVTEEGWCQKFGKVQYITNQQAQQFEGIRIIFESNLVEAVYRSWQKIVKQLQTNKQICQLLILPMYSGWIKQDHLCNYQKATVKSYEIIYNKFFTSLSNELKLRIQKKAHFQECQIWYIGYILFKVSSFFEERGWYLSNIHPKNIIIDPEGRVKIFTVFSSPLEPDHYQQFKSSKYNDAYIAPEQTNQEQENQSNNTDKNRIDSYCIGLVLLSIICLKDLYFVFNHFDLSIKVNVIQQMLGKIREKEKLSYSLYSMIKNLLETNPLDRKTPSQYFQILKKYQRNILDMESFQLDQIQQLALIKNNRPNKKKKYLKEITFLTLSQRYLQQSKKTQIKVGQFLDEQMDTSIKPTKPFYQDGQ